MVETLLMLDDLGGTISFGNIHVLSEHFQKGSIASTFQTSRNQTCSIISFLIDVCWFLAVKQDAMHSLDFDK